MTDPNETPTTREIPDPASADAAQNGAAETGSDLSGGAIHENVTSGPSPEGAPVSPTASGGARMTITGDDGADDGADDEPDDSQDAIAGTSMLRGLLLYAAVLAFAALYIDFIVQILSRSTAGAATLNPAMVGTAAALAGVLGSAFALSMGVTPRQLNTSLEQHIDRERKKAAKTKTPPKLTFALFLHKALSVEAGGKKDKSWPLTFGIWAYATVGSAVALTYIFNQRHTPDAVKALAVTFAGYILALIHNAFGSRSPG
jgi:hypothetical protein